MAADDGNELDHWGEATICLASKVKVQHADGTILISLVLGFVLQLARFRGFDLAGRLISRMKYLVSLFVALSVAWICWSGHFEPFVLFLGAISVIFSLWMVRRMGIDDNETAPLSFGLRPLAYMPYLIKEIAVSNWNVAKIVMSPLMPLQRNIVIVPSPPKSDIGRVVFANSITLTPGTVAIRLHDDEVLVHALSHAGAEEDLSGEMGLRVAALEGQSFDHFDEANQSRSDEPKAAEHRNDS